MRAETKAWYNGRHTLSNPDPDHPTFWSRVVLQSLSFHKVLSVPYDKYQGNMVKVLVGHQNIYLHYKAQFSWCVCVF